MIAIKLTDLQHDELITELTSWQEINNDVQTYAKRDNEDNTWNQAETRRQMLEGIAAATITPLFNDDELQVIKQYISKIRVVDADSDEDALLLYQIVRKLR